MHRTNHATRTAVYLPSALAVTGMMIASAHAALPVFYGPSESADSNGLSNPQQVQNGYVVNNAGVAVGSATKLQAGTGFASYGYRWRAVPNELPLQLAPLTAGAGYSSDAVAINDAGVIVGNSVKKSNTQGIFNPTRAMLYATPGSPAGVELQPSNNVDWQYSRVAALNKSGLVVGVSNRRQSNPTPFSTGETVQYAPGSTSQTGMSQPSNDVTHGFDSESTPVALNNNGIIVGTFTRYDVDGSKLGSRAVRWTPLLAAELRPINYQPNGYGESTATAVNASGVVVGSSVFFEDFTTAGISAVRWGVGTTAPTKLQSIGNTDLNGFTISQAYDLNDAGTSVGVSVQFNADQTTFTTLGTRWAANGTTGVKLNTIDNNPATSAVPRYINNVGGIAGLVTTGNAFGLDPSTSKAVVWAPNSAVAIDLSTLVQNAPGTTFVPNTINALTETGFVTGVGTYTSAGGTQFQRLYTMMIPQVGSYGRGDANFDTIINFDDLVVLAQNYTKLNASHAVTVGDFNLDGMTNFDDLILLAQNYSTGTVGTIAGVSSAFAADWALAQSLVPEPTVVGGVVCALVAFGLRQRR